MANFLDDDGALQCQLGGPSVSAWRLPLRCRHVGSIQLCRPICALAGTWQSLIIAENGKGTGGVVHTALKIQLVHRFKFISGRGGRNSLAGSPTVSSTSWMSTDHYVALWQKTNNCIYTHHRLNFSDPAATQAEQRQQREHGPPRADKNASRREWVQRFRLLMRPQIKGTSASRARTC